MNIRVHYPLERGEVALRADDDWERDIPPRRASADRTQFDFELDRGRPYRYFKPVLREGGDVRWSQGANVLAVRNGGTREVFPYFAPDASCHVCNVHAVPSCYEERGYEVRVFLPPGYDENELERFPALYMQDGHNLFFPDEASGGRHWRVGETLGVLESMNLVRKVIVVGIYPRERMREYTAPGYEAYASFLARELKPWVDAHYRTLPERRHTAVLGSSLGGVVSLFAGWQHAETFGQVGCMSSTFGYADDLLERVLREKRRPIRIYLDTGWPGDNYEVTRGMRAALALRGYREGKDLRYVAFPEARHDEESWAQRVHLPLQFFYGE